jgi:hypothetical protein
MEKEKRIYNWIIAGLRQSPNWFSEIFYFDKRDEQFFSILVTDYFLFDEDFSPADGIQSTYSESTIELLADRMRRMHDEDDTNIIALPRCGEGLDDYQEKADSFLNLNAIDLEKATIWDINESGSINVKIT